MAGRNGRDGKLIWDLPVRIVHWLLTLLIGFSWYTVEVSGNMQLHMLSGYTILTLLVFRIVWGFVGPRYARFSSFLYSPSDVMHNARKFVTREPSGYAGHGPLGALSVFLLLALVAVQVSTGLFATDEDFYAGPLNEHISAAAGRAVTSVHETNFNLLLLFIILHVAAVLYYLIFKRENLIGAMITGRKRIPDEQGSAIQSSKVPLAATLVVAIAGCVYGMVTLL